MGDHQTGHPDGQRACDELLAALANELPGVERKHAKAMCAFYLPGRANFAFVYHLKTKRRLDVWFPSLGTERFEPHGTVRPTIRRKLGTPWADNWAWHFEIESSAQAHDGAAFLVQFAQDKRRSRAAHVARPTIAEELPEHSDQEHTEGAATQILVNRYERDPKARARCVSIHGARCKACSFTFGTTYGARFASLITVHHITPLSSVGKTYRVNPESDLVPLCPNCHLLVHQRTPPYSVEEVQEMLRAQRRPPVSTAKLPENAG